MRVLLLASCTVVVLGQSGVMGPLLTDTTALTYNGGGCINGPGDANPVCADVGVVSDAAACAASCANVSFCSAVTFHGPTTGQWAYHCVHRLDDVWDPVACGSGCDHVASQKTSGWQPQPAPAPPAWLPTTTGWTGFIKPFWFGANASGLDSADTLALISRHAVGGYGWQTGHPGGGSVGVGEELLAQAATNLWGHLNDVGNPNKTVLFVYRQIQVALRLFAQCALAADDPALSGFWLANPSTGEVCLAGQPWGTSDPYWNMTNASASAYWVNQVIGELATEIPLTSGGGAVFFDEVDQGECGYRGGSCDFGAFDAAALQASKIATYKQMVCARRGTGAGVPCRGFVAEQQLATVRVLCATNQLRPLYAYSPLADPPPSPPLGDGHECRQHHPHPLARQPYECVGRRHDRPAPLRATRRRSRCCARGPHMGPLLRGSSSFSLSAPHLFHRASSRALAPISFAQQFYPFGIARYSQNWPQSFWVPGGPDLAAAMIQNAILEGEAGIPVVLHAGGNCPAPERTITRPGPLGGDVEYQVATYLIVATEGATLSISSGWMDNNFCWRPDFDVEFGAPLGPAVRTSVYTWERNFTRSTVALDVQSSSGSVMLLA